MAPFWHRWSYFSIINLSVFHLADKCFTITNLINLRIILFLEYRKTPETLRFRGILRLDTMLSYDNKSIFRLYYSMIVATRPDPTVRPPSRFVGYKILLLLGVFQALFYLYYSKFVLLFEVLIFFRTIVEPQIYKLKFVYFFFLGFDVGNSSIMLLNKFAKYSLLSTSSTNNISFAPS